MSDGFLLDTHFWLWLQGGMDAQTGAVLGVEAAGWAAAGQAYVSAISVWEIALLEGRQRISLDREVSAWVQEGTAAGRLQLLPLSPEVLIQATRLPGEVHRDPADRMLLATALVHGLTLVTRDKLLVDYGRQGFVRVMER